MFPEPEISNPAVSKDPPKLGLVSADTCKAAPVAIIVVH